MTKFRVTYEIVTPESAEHGDAESRGFVMPGDWRDDIETAMTQPRNAYDISLREAMDLADCAYDCGRWWTESEGRCNYRTGAIETRSIHPPENITAASYARVSRLLGVRP